MYNRYIRNQQGVFTCAEQEDAEAGRAAAENLDAAAGARTVSSIVFHSPQSGHFPAHFAVS